MSGRSILLKIDNKEVQIPGDSQVMAHMDRIRVNELTINADATPHFMGGSSVISHRAVDLSIAFGPWVAELQQAAWHGKSLDDIEIFELEHKLDKVSKKEFKVIRKFTLKGAHVQGMSHSWMQIHSTVKLSLYFDSIVFESNEKLAEFNHLDAGG